MTSNVNPSVRWAQRVELYQTRVLQASLASAFVPALGAAAVGVVFKATQGRVGGKAYTWLMQPHVGNRMAYSSVAFMGLGAAALYWSKYVLKQK